MNSISEPRLMVFLFRIIPPLICASEYVGISILVSMLFLAESTPMVVGLIVLVAFVGLAMMPFWYKTFFDRAYIGPDRPLVVQWSSDSVLFIGAYFRLQVPLNDILLYQPLGFRGYEKAFTLRVKIRKPNGKVDNAYLSTTMPRKKEFISFLEQHCNVI